MVRWGDHAPCDRSPIEHAADMARRGRVVPTWEFGRDRNVFGLAMPSDPYPSELVADADQSRDGDGGSTTCGGAGFFLGWLTLATAYCEDECGRHDPTESLASGCTGARRVFNLG